MFSENSSKFIVIGHFSGGGTTGAHAHMNDDGPIYDGSTTRTVCAIGEAE